ncbi:MAG: hypothetical protein WCI27_09830 [Candidatus Omnitrophota bacterium]
MSQNISPEERLFNVIKAGRNPVRAEAPAGVPPADAPAPFLQNINLHAVNEGLMVCLACLAALGGWMFFSKKEIPLQQLAELPVEHVPAVAVEKVEAYQPVSAYLQQVKKRDVFRPVTAGGASPAEIPAAANKDFVLSGIYMGPVPQVIITVNPDQKAYFLKEGDDIKGYRVKSILKNKVVLQRGDEEIELL